MRALLDKGPNVGLSALSMSSITTDPHYQVSVKMAEKATQRLYDFEHELEADVG